MSNDPYALTLIGDGASLKKRIPTDLARKIFNLVLAGNSPVSDSTGQLKDRGDEDAGDVPSPKRFMADKRPNNDTERLVCLAYYLTRYGNKTRFKTKDLTTLNSEAAQPRFSNASVTARNATNQQQYLTLAGGGDKQITSRGEALVEALPDREKAKAAVAAHPLSRRRKKKPVTTGKD